MKHPLIGIALLPPIAIILATMLYFLEQWWFIAVPLMVLGIYKLERRWGVWQARSSHYRVQRPVVPRAFNH